MFYDGLLPHVARPDEMDRVSTAGYALGYLGGGALLAVSVALILRPHAFGLADAGAAIRLSFAMTEGWWLVFAIPLLRHVPEPEIPAGQRARGAAAIRAGLTDLRHAWRLLRQFPEAGKLLLAKRRYHG